MNRPKPQQGRLARSLAGRDEGRYMLLYELIDDEYVAVVDGRTHRLASPKKKKLKHLRLLPYIDENVIPSLDTQAGTADSDIRKAIERLVQARAADAQRNSKE